MPNQARCELIARKNLVVLETSGARELRRARKVLRDLQAQSSDWLGKSSVGSVLPEAIAWLSTWPLASEAFAAPHGAVLPYPQSRLLQTRRIVERIEPGALEHAQLPVTLAWQAAAIETEIGRGELIDVSAPVLATRTG